jgi:hypothetical protein
VQEQGYLTTIKTVNGQSLSGEGDISIVGEKGEPGEQGPAGVVDTKVIYSGSGTGKLTVTDISNGTVFLWYGKHNGHGGTAVIAFTKDQFGKTIPGKFNE